MRTYPHVRPPVELMMDRTVTGSEFRIFCALLFHADNKSMKTYVSLDTLGYVSGMSRNTAQRCVAGLIEKGWVEIIAKQYKGSNKYQLFPEKKANKKHPNLGTQDGISTRLTESRVDAEESSSTNLGPQDGHLQGQIGELKYQYGTQSCDTIYINESYKIEHQVGTQEKGDETIEEWIQGWTDYIVNYPNLPVEARRGFLGKLKTWVGKDDEQLPQYKCEVPFKEQLMNYYFETLEKIIAEFGYDSDYEWYKIFARPDLTLLSIDTGCVSERRI